MRPPPAVALLALLVALAPIRSSGVEDEKVVKPAAQPLRGAETLYGPALSCSVEVPGRALALPVAAPAGAAGTKPLPAPKIPPSQLVPKGITVKLGGNDAGAITFDTDLMRMAIGWTHGFLDLKKTNIATYKGFDTGAGVVKGDVQFETLPLPGWSVDESFADPRPEKMGPLSPEIVRYKGMYLHGDRAVFAYTVAGADVLESPELKKAGEQAVLVRYFNVAPSKQALSVLLELPLKEGEKLGDSGISDLTKTLVIPRPESTTSLAVANAPTGASIRSGRAGVYLMIPAHEEPLSFAVSVSRTPAEAKTPELAGVASPVVLADLCKGGPSRWPELPSIAGTLATDNAGYVVDTIPLPEDNPWKSWMRLSAFDFLPDGRAVVATLNGDVWLVSGLDGKLEKVRWKRIAVGLYEPLGLKVRDGEIFVHGKDQITRLKDLNGDSEIDYYERFNGDRAAVANYHTFAFDLQTDREGNFYYVIGGNQLGTHRPWHACVVKVSRDGAKSEIIATGFRAPNGLTVGPEDEIIVSDNQGQWIPSSKLNLIRPGGFYGHVADPRIEKAKAPTGYDQPICWIPMTMDNSSAGGVWQHDSGKWGPLGGHLLHISFGTASLFAVLPQAISTEGITLPADGNHRAPTMQASIVKIPVRFLSGTMRGRFSPVDGQLYVSGLKGWQTVAAKDGCFQRVRYTGVPVTVPTGVQVSGDTLRLTFAAALDRQAAGDPQAYSLEQWNYKWWETYGSPDLSPSQPAAKKRDRLDVTAAEVSADGRTLTLKVPDLRFAMETLLKGNLRFADGTEAALEVAGTYYNVPAPIPAGTQ